MINKIQQVATHEKAYWFYLVLAFLLFQKRIIAVVKLTAANFGLTMSQDEKEQEREEQLEQWIVNNPSVSMSVNGQILTASDLKTTADQVAEALGTSYSWYNPSGWTEDEERVIDLLLPHNPDTFEIIEEFYETSTGRDLVEDLESYLSNNQIIQLEFLW